MEDERNTGQAVVPDGIPGSSANETETLEPATDAVPEDIPKELTKKEKRAQRALITCLFLTVYYSNKSFLKH